jgi:hypothetical protein
MPNSRLSDSHGPLLRRIASTTRNVRIDILDEQETLLAPVGLCDLCSMPNKPGYDYCYPCSRAPRAAVDGLIPLAFAPKGEQLYRDLVAYKRQSTPSPAFRRLAALARVSSCHMPCIERVYGTIDTLTVIPSTQGRSKGMLWALAEVLCPDRPRARLDYVGPATTHEAKRREPVDGDFAAGSEVRGKRVLLVDDSWVTGAGGPARAPAAAALRAAGAASVVVTVLGRVLDPRNWPPTQTFLDMWQDCGIPTAYDPAVCPATRRPHCPARHG